MDPFSGKLFLNVLCVICLIQMTKEVCSTTLSYATLLAQSLGVELCRIMLSFTLEILQNIVFIFIKEKALALLRFGLRDDLR